MASPTRTHNWVKHIVVPVDVVTDPDDEGVVAIVDPVKLQEAEGRGVFGCQNCSLPLTPETSVLPCEGGE